MNHRTIAAAFLSLAVPGAACLATGPMPSLGPAADFAILGLGGSITTHGDVIVNSATSVVGDIGYGAYTDSHTNQKIDSFIGKALVHSTATFEYTAATFQPSGGIFFGVTDEGVNIKLDLASAMAAAASAACAGMSPTHTLGTVNSDTTVTSTGAVNVLSMASLDLNGQTLTLRGRAGSTDIFIINVAGDFDFSQSAIVLQDTDAAHVLFNFTGSGAQVTINKSATAFSGTVLAALPGQSVIYHNPATFNGAIIAYSIDVHSDFNINHVGFVPSPSAAALLGLGGLAAMRRRRH